MAAVPTHWLRGNETEWSPRWVGFLDTETWPDVADGREVQRLRCWAATIVDRRPEGTAGPIVSSGVGFTRQSLAEWVTSSMRGRRNLWLFAHNLGFDLTVTRLPDFLHRQGWTMGDFRFAGRNTSGYLTRRSKTLWLVDSSSWWPKPLAELGRMLDLQKLPRPAIDADEDAWVDYCQRDVAVLAKAVLELLDWWDRELLGHFAKTGPGCGWNALRHLGAKRLFLIRPDPAGVTHDRSAVRGGRRDACRIGPVDGGPFALVDFSDAYLTVAANMLLPKGRLAWHDSYRPDDVRVDGNRFGVIADCLIDTPVPRYPVKVAGSVFYPVGRFRTTLASPEIVAARRAGHLVSIGPGFCHDMGFPLQPWAKWCLRQLDPARSEVPAVVRAAVKQWGRSVIGKFAARTSRKVDRGPACWPGWHLEPGTSGPDHLPAVDLHIAGRHWWVVQDTDGENAYPAVLAWVESHVRVALGAMLGALGEGVWVTADTDGAVIDLSAAARWLSARLERQWRSKDPVKTAGAVCDQLAAVCRPLTPRVKAISRTLTVAGPQHFTGDSFERHAGRPGSMERDDRGGLRFWSWPSTGWQIQHGHPDGFVRVETGWTEPAVTVHRWVLADGCAVAPVVQIGEDGQNHLLPWSELAPAWSSSGLAGAQSPALRGLW